MTNKEKFKNEIVEIALNGIVPALSKNKLVACKDLYCYECDWRGDCRENRLAWANAEYVEPTVDWSKVPVDTKILVSDQKTSWVKRHFAKYKNGKIYAFMDGGSSWTTERVTTWDYAKLAEEEE